MTEWRHVLVLMAMLSCAGVRALAEGLTLSSAEIDGNGNWVQRCTVPRRGKAKLLVPYSVGELRYPKWEALTNGTKLITCEPGWGMCYHMLALLNESGDSYAIIQQGARFYATQLTARIGKHSDEVVFETAYVPVAADEFAGKLPFESVVVPFKGGWFSAAQVYKRIVENEPWVKYSRERDFGKLRDIGFWFWNRLTSDIVIPPVEQFMRDAGVPVALDWYWWHSNSYDTAYPNYWPPREGVEKFRRAVKRMNDLGIYCQTYVNGMTWDMDDPSWEKGGTKCARRRKDGSFPATAWNRFTNHRLAEMCGEAPEFQSIMRDTVRKILACGFDGQYLDMIGNASYQPCYATNHVHSPGGGDHMVKNYRKYVLAVKADNPGVQFSTEECNEAYMDLFDGCVCLSPSYERFAGAGEVKIDKVPVFLAVYHGAVAVYGSFAMLDGIPAWDPLWPDSERWTDEKDWIALFPDQFQVELARCVVWGTQPFIHNFRIGNTRDPHCAPGYRFMIDTARFYYSHRDFLFNGEMRDPGTMECEELKVEFLNRGTYSKKGEYAVAYHVLPTVFHSIWRNAKGETAVVLVNWSRARQHYRLSAPDGKTEGDLAPRSWKLESLDSMTKNRQACVFHFPERQQCGQ